VWGTPQEIEDGNPSASFVGRNRVVFNIKGNAFRRIVALTYRIGVGHIRFIGDHAEYYAIDAETIDLASLIMEIRPPHTVQGNQGALNVISALVDADPEAGTPKSDRLDVTSILVERYGA